MKFLLNQAKIPTGMYEIDGVEVVTATDGSKEALFIMNHNGYPVTVPVEGEYKEMISGEKIEKIVFLKPYDVAILS